MALGLRAIHHVTKRVGRAVTTFELLLRGEGEAWLAAGRAGRRGDRQLELFALSTRVKASRTGPWSPLTSPLKSDSIVGEDKGLPFSSPHVATVP